MKLNTSGSGITLCTEKRYCVLKIIVFITVLNLQYTLVLFINSMNFFSLLCNK